MLPTSACPPGQTDGGSSAIGSRGRSYATGAVSTSSTSRESIRNPAVIRSVAPFWIRRRSVTAKRDPRRAFSSDAAASTAAGSFPSSRTRTPCPRSRMGCSGALVSRAGGRGRRRGFGIRGTCHNCPTDQVAGPPGRMRLNGFPPFRQKTLGITARPSWGEVFLGPPIDDDSCKAPADLHRRASCWASVDDAIAKSRLP